MKWLPVALLCLLAACSKVPEAGAPQSLEAFDVEEPAKPAADAPQIAYSYDLLYRLSAGEIARVQARHVEMCADLTRARCVMLKSSLSDGDGSDASGETQLLVDARLAPAFTAKLDAAALGAGGSVATREVAAEDVTRELIDTDARVRAKQALADRLVRLIQSADAKVGDLVEAEKAYAQTQEELDSARTVQATLRRRVAMSAITVRYSTSARTGALSVIGESLREGGGTLAGSVAVLITFVIAAFPWALLLIGLVWIARRRGWRWRWPFRRRGSAGVSID